MKKIVMISLFAAISLFVTSCGRGSSKVNNPIETKAEKVLYTCEMHPEVISDKSGKCPKCGMELVKKLVPANADTTRTQMVN